MFRRVTRAAQRRCPRCGARGIFTGWWAMRDRCPECDLRYESEEGYWLGAIAINTGATIAAFTLVFVGVIVTTWPSPPWGLVSALTIATCAAVPIAFYPISKTLWVAIDLTLQGE